MTTKIISVRKGFASDHSSTSYEFLTVDRPLDRKARAQVASLSSRAQPTQRRVSFIYHADGYDIPGGWEPLLRDHYDVMYSESYDWWTLALAFNADEKRQQEIADYAFEGADDLGVGVSTHDERLIVSIYCRLDPGAAVFHRSGYEEYHDFEEDEEEDEDNGYASDDALLSLLAEVRQQLIDGDYRALYAVWEVYGYGDDEEKPGEDDEEAWPTPPVAPEQATGKEVVDRLRDTLVTL